MGRLKGKSCIVTGGAKGLGLAFSKALLGEGANVLIADVADGSEAAAQIGARYKRTDVSDPTDASDAADACIDAFGGIDILVNNAAVYATLPLARYDEIDPELWDKVMAVNVRGAFNMVRAAGPHMERQKSGKIINVTSGTVYKGMPGMLHYIASKGALTAMTRALSRELGPAGICVNSLAPGLTLSSSILENEEHVDVARPKVIASRALARDAYPDDLLGALIFLASSDSDFVTGQTVAVDGGSINT
ncbi:SDR family NAD(P)-dependent oxidoreductase [Hoeflea poritis]|uniref:SDR family oxidoreductase n=1 Tax=Hoeflea poritis TaxID=2993659 RepID=A0ABT4VIX0_9HYPH|nr:SDR family oxidoreductase [Hoeflea poritis]MDA4844647.1 SDR family oxidoreductase [Hoeflea poritis]